MIELHVVLLENMLVLFTKNSDGNKLVLKVCLYEMLELNKPDCLGIGTLKGDQMVTDSSISSSDC